MPIKPLPRPPGAAQGSVLMSVDSGGGGQYDPFPQIAGLDVVGDSHISEYGPTLPDFGITQKVAGLLLPTLFRDCALGGALHSWPVQGNGALGDGGWASIATEFDRQEQSTNRYNSTITQTQASGVASYTVASVTQGAAPTAGEWVVIGAGANTEVIQISQSWNGASPITFATNTTLGHTSADPIYHACRNEGYLAKSAVVVMCAEGANDLGHLGPGAPPSPLSSNWSQGTFGTTLGASRGLGPFMQALRFSIANLRCSVIYKDTHPAIVYGTSPVWTSNPVTSTASYPTIYCFGGGNAGNYHSCAANLAQITFTTAPDFLGGTVVAFFGTGIGGQGAIWDYSVSGATTVAMTSHAANSQFDNRSFNVVNMNNPSASGSVCGTCMRITGLNAGRNVITLQATTVTTSAFFLGIGIEAPNPPLILALQTSRIAPGATPPGNAYNVRATGAITGATVTAGQGAAAGQVAFVGGTLTLGVAGTISQTAAQINDTLTLDKGNANEETRRIVGFTGSPATACQVDANFVNAHTNAPIALGTQDADFMGGGYFNTADTQGATSVPGCAAVIQSVVNEFDANVLTMSMDKILGGGPGTTVDPLNFWQDGVHYNDKASGTIAAAIAQVITAQPRSVASLAAAAMTDKRTWQAIYGDVGASPAASPAVITFQNAWTNVYSSTFANATLYPRTGYLKDERDRRAYVRGAVTGGGGNGSAIFTLPAGYRPVAKEPLGAYGIAEDGTFNSAEVSVSSAGVVTCETGYPGATGALFFNGSFPAEQ